MAVIDLADGGRRVFAVSPSIFPGSHAAVCAEARPASDRKTEVPGICFRRALYLPFRDDRDGEYGRRCDSVISGRARRVVLDGSQCFYRSVAEIRGGFACRGVSPKNGKRRLDRRTVCLYFPGTWQKISSAWKSFCLSGRDGRSLRGWDLRSGGKCQFLPDRFDFGDDASTARRSASLGRKGFRCGTLRGNSACGIGCSLSLRRNGTNQPAFRENRTGYVRALRALLCLDFDSLQRPDSGRDLFGICFGAASCECQRRIFRLGRGRGQPRNFLQRGRAWHVADRSGGRGGRHAGGTGLDLNDSHGV